ncbi:hypothetical protein Lqui_0036 [Legionella quinlivanii]|uniref:Transmembrane protein n=1 Tax=Legionella quinlivanii TaxID=45073 RepID=A0A0W0Y7U2_9GAMM|nr:hypothetical protein [Legionella quinlivanii]KTD53081.1 hypothetical protein Lqui_0036 [Legionella quinlivanii]SEG17021.1 hypothetical protein SAMN02746093_02079 [Legionella quinlivanii DSM 21216]STY10462.1 Uncharacterised protein [Legionella quinlivanii]
MNHETVVVDQKLCAPHHHWFCWSAIIIGALVGLGLGFLLHLYSIAIGLTAFVSDNEATTVTIGGLIGLLIGTIVAMGLAGFTAGFLAHVVSPGVGILYGFATWSLALLLTAILAMPLSSYVSTYTAALAPTVNVDTGNTTAQGNQVTVQSPATEATKAASPETLAWSGWIVFVLFAIGALSSCLGACGGIHCHRKHCLHSEV